MAKKKSKKKLWIVLISIFGVIALGVGSFFIYVSIHYEPTQDALTYLEDSTFCEVRKEDDYITFQPKMNKIAPITKDGIIFYPGGKVDYRSYAPLLRDLADVGVTSILCKMPFNLAVFDVNAAKGKQSIFPKVENWYISGHSLGGAMASEYLSSHAADFKGLILLGSYSTKDLNKEGDLRSLSILASNDNILNKDKYEENKKNLPDLTERTIEGGIHSYFGDYGLQKGDGTPSISFDEQKKQIVGFVSLFLLAGNV